MGVFSRKPQSEATIIAQAEAPRFERVEWTKEPGLRKLYFYAFILCIASATTGYDGLASPNYTPRQIHKTNSTIPQIILQQCPELRVMEGFL